MLARGSFGFPLAAADRWGDDSANSGSKDEDDNDMDEDMCGANEHPTGTKPKRKRPKFIRKVECQVCHVFGFIQATGISCSFKS